MVGFSEEWGPLCSSLANLRIYYDLKGGISAGDVLIKAFQRVAIYELVLLEYPTLLPIKLIVETDTGTSLLTCSGLYQDQIIPQHGYNIIQDLYYRLILLQ